MPFNFFRYGVVAFVTFAAVVGHSASRDLRPSQHGLAYQEHASSPAQNEYAKELSSFFGSAASSVPLPEARSAGDDAWWSDNGDGRPRDHRRDHVRVGLLAATAVFGVAGVFLLVVSGIIFVARRRKQKAQAGILSSTSELHAPNDK